MKNRRTPPQPWLRQFAALCVIPLAVSATALAQEPATPTAAPAAPTTAPAPKTPAETDPAQEEDILVLSPFTVDATKDKGYFAENTLAGSRMKTKLSDLGASISVVNTAQMEDFASTGINDVFRYEVNTEGSLTYTPGTSTMRGDGILDVNAGGTQGSAVASFTNSQANRVRGLGVPSAGINYYPTIGAIAADAYNTQSFEISRGPNSLLFGVGSPAGMINQTTTQAMLGQNKNKVVISFDDRGSYRTSISFNRELIHNQLAIFGAALWDDKRFERKPSYDNTRRIYGALTYKPFSKLAVRGNFEDYKNYNRRPNTISPVDLVTQWNLAGRPVYNALTKQFSYLSTGKVQGPYISSNSSVNNTTANAQMVRNYIMSMPSYNASLRNVQNDSTFTTYNGVTIFGQSAITTIGSALYVPGVVELNQGRSKYQILGGQVWNWYQPLYGQGYHSTSYTDNLTNNPTTNMYNSAVNSDYYDRDSFSSAGWTNVAAISKIGNYKYAGVTDRSIYDWKKINIAEANFGSEKNKNYELDFDLQITDDLYLTGGWLRQDFNQKTNYTISQLNATAITVDINQYLPNGTANPFYGLPYVTDRDPDQYRITQTDDHFRAALAYTPDFTKSNGLLHWLGHHQILGMWSRDESIASSTRMRLFYTGADTTAGAYRYLPNSTVSGWSYYTSSAVVDRMFYLANPGDAMGKVTRSSGEWNPESYHGNIQVFNYASGQPETVGVTQSYSIFDAPQRTQRILDSINGGMTNYLWKDRLVTTFGLRSDKFRARQTTTGAINWDDGTSWAALSNVDKFLSDGTYNTSAVWNRFGKWVRNNGTTKTGGGVLHPFSGWSGIENSARNGNQFWQLVRDFGISYNWSNNFNPPLGVEIDAFGKPVPKSYGSGHDIGFQFAALDGKLFARVTWFSATNMNQRQSGNASTAMSRLTSNMDTTLFRGWARTIAIINRGADAQGRTDPTNANFDKANSWSATEEQQIQDAAAVIWKQSYTYYNDLGGGSVVTTGNAKSTGIEAQVNYNTGNWRNRFTFSQTKTVNWDMLKEFDAWYAYRAPIMMAARAQNYLNATARAAFPAIFQTDGSVTYTNSGGTAVNLTNFWTGYGFNSAVKLTDTSGNTSVQNYYNVNVSPSYLLARDLNGEEAPGARKFRWSYNTGYDFSKGWMKGIGIGGAERWEARSIIGYYGKSSGTNVTIPDLIDQADTTKPIYDKANYYTDLFIKYRRKIWTDKLTWTIQLNVENVMENGHLQTVAVNYDGSPYGYRIVDSRRFVLTSTFEF